MAIAFEQSTSKTLASGTTDNLAFLSNVKAGSLLVVAVRLGAGGRTLTTTDNNGNPTYTQAFVQTDGAEDIFLQYVPNANAGATTVTITITGAATSLRWAIHEYSGMATSSPLDQKASTSGSSTALSSGATPTTTVANELLFGIGDSQADKTFTKDASYTLREIQGAAPATRLATEDQIVSATGAYTATFTIDATGGWGCGIATFKAAAAGGTGVISTGGATLNTGLRIPILARFP